ncbi:MAG: insulinase family protein, partial [Tannerella sp.]|nr:insulinase family protein [Tannerella sp.]
IEKPAITPIQTNRNLESAFLDSIEARPTTPIQPVFLDYGKDLAQGKIKEGIPLLYKQNTQNPIFSLNYVFDMGNNEDKALGTAFTYLNYLGTSTRTAAEIKSELFSLACSFNLQATNDRVYVNLSGLSDNFDQALALLEDRLNNARPDTDAYRNLVADILKSRQDKKTNQAANFAALRAYAVYGPDSPYKHILSEEELKAMKPEELLAHVKDLKDYRHTILYYGPLTEKQITEKLNAAHVLGSSLKPVPKADNFTEQETKENRVLLAQYDAKQIYLSMLHKGGAYEPGLEPVRELFNDYFGGGMNTVVFQELREARGLAYSANAVYQAPSRPDRAYYMNAFIASQTDKTKDAIQVFRKILDQMPVSEKAFSLAKANLMKDLRTGRILRENILWNYLNAEKFGYTTDKRRDIYKALPGLTLDSLTAFQQKYVKGLPYTYCILGNEKDLDMGYIRSLGPVTELSQKDIFGY